MGNVFKYMHYTSPKTGKASKKKVPEALLARGAGGRLKKFLAEHGGRLEKHWRIEWVDALGKQRREVVKGENMRAVRRLVEVEERVELQRAGEAPLEDYAKKISMVREEYRARLRQIRSKNTLKAFDTAAKRVIDQGGFKMIAELTRERLRRWRELEYARGGTRGNVRSQTLDGYVRQVRLMLAWAEDEDRIRKNPLRGWQNMLKDDPRERRDLTREEIERLLGATANEERRLRWLLYASTGLRNRGGVEIRWGWIDWESSEIRIPGSSRKGRAPHVVPMNVALRKALLGWRGRSRRIDPSGHVFRPLTARHVLRAFKSDCEAAGIDTRGVCLHSMRHAVGTMVYKQSGLKAAQELLGHKHPQTTLAYLHTTEEAKREAVEGLIYHPAKVSAERAG